VLTSIAVSAAAMVTATLIIALARGVVTIARTVQMSTAAVTSLVGSVAELQRDNAENRERIAVLMADRWPRDSYPGFTPHYRWDGRT
jgi:uncharacterized ion transporter superfamily protein YfcC